MKKIILLLPLLILLAASPAFPMEGISDGAMMADVLLVRPVGIASIAAGTALFILAVPFAVLGGNLGQSACEFVEKPVAFTIARPVGDFGQMDAYYMRAPYDP